MKRLTAIILVVIMLLSLVACGQPTGGKKEDTSGSGGNQTTLPDNNTGDIDSYAAAYEFTAGLIEAFSAAINDKVDAYNSAYEAAHPDTYYFDDAYLGLIILIPFLSIDRAFTASFDEATQDSYVQLGIETALAMFGATNIRFTHSAANSYKIEYDHSDNDGNVSSYKMEANYNPSNKSMRFVETNVSLGQVDEFFEFVPLGANKYAMIDESSRAIITYSNGSVSELYYSEKKNSSGFSNVEADVRHNDANQDSIYPNASGVDINWVTGNTDDLELIITIVNGVMTVKRCKYDIDYSAGTAEWIWLDDVVLN